MRVTRLRIVRTRIVFRNADSSRFVPTPCWNFSSRESSRELATVRLGTAANSSPLGPSRTPTVISRWR